MRSLWAYARACASHATRPPAGGPRRNREPPCGAARRTPGREPLIATGARPHGRPSNRPPRCRRARPRPIRHGASRTRSKGRGAIARRVAGATWFARPPRPSAGVWTGSGQPRPAPRPATGAPQGGHFGRRLLQPQAMRWERLFDPPGRVIRVPPRARGLLACVFIWSTPATCRSASPSSRLAGSTCSPRATPRRQCGDPIICDETLDAVRPDHVQPGDVVGIGIHTGNALRGYESAGMPARRGAWVVFGGIHATLFPDEAARARRRPRRRQGRRRRRLAHASSPTASPGTPQRDLRRRPGRRRAVRVGALGPAAEGRYMWASVQTVRGCPKHCSFCSVWRTDGQEPRQRGVDARRRGDRRAAPARASGSSRSPTTTSIRSRSTTSRRRARRADPSRLQELEAIRAERFELMEQLAQLPDDMVFFTQITMEAAEDPEFLDAMRAATSAARWSASNRSPPRAEGRLQGLQPARRRAGRAAADVLEARHPRARVVHLRAAERPAGHLRGDGRARRAGRT